MKAIGRSWRRASDFALKDNLSSVGPVDAGQYLYEGRLARPVLTQQSQHLAATKLERSTRCRARVPPKRFDNPLTARIRPHYPTGRPQWRDAPSSFPPSSTPSRLGRARHRAMSRSWAGPRRGATIAGIALLEAIILHDIESGVQIGGVDQPVLVDQYVDRMQNFRAVAPRVRRAAPAAAAPAPLLQRGRTGSGCHRCAPRHSGTS